VLWQTCWRGQATSYYVSVGKVRVDKFVGWAGLGALYVRDEPNRSNSALAA
jgi:hypothetical protein